MNDLRKYSPLTYLAERFFFALQYVSIANLLFDTRIGIQNRLPKDRRVLQTVTKKRGWQIESYVAIVSILLAADALLLPHANTKLSWILLIIPVYRIVEISVVTINIGIFDALRLKRRIHYVSGVTRTVVLSIWNYFEILFAFAIIYRTYLPYLRNAHSFMDTLYFSAATQLTIGYGDIVAIEPIRFIPAIQGLLGLFFALVILGRFISLLPTVKTVQRDGALSFAGHSGAITSKKHRVLNHRMNQYRRNRHRRSAR